jgi:hypothetical protein
MFWFRYDSPSVVANPIDDGKEVLTRHVPNDCIRVSTFQMYGKCATSAFKKHFLVRAYVTDDVEANF